MKVSILIFLLCISCSSFAENYSNILLGKKLTHLGASCAGLSFDKNGKDAFMYGEQPLGICSKDLALKVKWLDSKTFILIEKNQRDETSPPRTFLYRIKNLNGSKVSLTEIWTGWNDFKDNDQKYTLTND